MAEARLGTAGAAPTAAATSAPRAFNVASWLTERNVAEGRGDRVAVRAPGRTMSYAELSDEVRAAATGLRALGVRPEERVMLFMVDGVELFVGILAAMYLGAVAVPVSTMLTDRDLADVLVDSRARVLLASAEFADTVRAAVTVAPDLAEVVLAGGPVADGPPAAGGSRTWLSLLGAGDPVTSPYWTWPDSPALWLYTSGTTGKPKAAMHRHVDVRFVAQTYAARVLGITEDDICLSVAKLFFAYGIGNSMFFPLSVGASAVLEPSRPGPRAFADLARAERPTLFFAVPTFYAALLASDVAHDSFASVRQAVSAGEALPARVFERILDRFGFEILDGIGSTEALHIFLSNRAGAVRPGSSGTPVPGYDVQIRHSDGRVLTGVDEPGVLFVRGESIATGYWCRAAGTRAAFQGEWLRTGDTYVRNADGSYSYLARTDDMMKVGGIWVSPFEVETRLLEHPDVAEVAVVGVPDAEGLDKPVACVVPVAGRHLDLDALIEFCRAGLAAFKRPRHVVEVAVLPKTATGKVQRFAVRNEMQRRLAPEQAGSVVP